jgi:hypothetical protein
LQPAQLTPVHPYPWPCCACAPQCCEAAACDVPAAKGPAELLSAGSCYPPH